MNTQVFTRAIAGLSMAAAFAFSAAPASAGTATTTVTVTANVIANCTFSSPTNLAFGNYDPVVANAATNLNASPNTLSVACTKGDAATIALDLGANFTGTTRRMKDAATDYLTYEVYTTAAHATVWNAANTVAYTSAGKAAVLLPMYGVVASGQDAVVGAYTDTLTATITF